MELKIKKKFKDAQRHLTESERDELEKHIFADGKVLDPIIVDQHGYIVDGHNRHAIATEHGLPFETKVVEFESDEAAVTWILWHQVAKRNLSEADASLAMGRLYNATAAPVKGHSVPSEEPSKRRKRKVEVKEIAKRAGKSTKTVTRAGKYAAAYDKLPASITNQIKANPQLATQKAVLRMAEMPPGDWGPLARAVRVGEAKTFDEAVFGKDSPKVEKPGKLAGDADPKKARAAIGVLVRYFDAKEPTDSHSKYLCDQLLGRIG